MGNLDSVAFAILAVSFLIVTLIGFASARWRPAEDPMHLNEWGLGVLPGAAFAAGPAAAASPNGVARDSHSPGAAGNWPPRRGGHGKHGTRNGR